MKHESFPPLRSQEEIDHSDTIDHLDTYGSMKMLTVAVFFSCLGLAAALVWGVLAILDVLRNMEGVW